MNRKVNVMGAEDFKETGMFFYCSSDDVSRQSRSDVLECLKGAEKITLENEKEYKIMMIDPMMAQFTNKAVFLVKVDAKDIPAGIYPTTATIH